jgi:hypothetical protein
MKGNGQMPDDFWYHYAPPPADRAEASPPKMSARDLDLPTLWRAFQRTYYYSSSEARFRQYLRKLVTNPAALDDLAFCHNCQLPAWNDGMHPAGQPSRLVRICQSCYDSWTDCTRCGSRFPDDDLHAVGDDRVCGSCLAAGYAWCSPCGNYYRNSDARDHDHGSCCTSPQLEFAIRNSGGQLASDTRATITLPAGTISPEGLEAISLCLRRYYNGSTYPFSGLAYSLEPLGAEWQSRTGNYAKRLSSFAYKTGVKIPPEVLSQVGNIARDHSQPVDLTIDVTRLLNRPAASFSNPGSCWWGGYSNSRCALKTNGGLGLRSLDERGRVTGRAWVMPLKRTSRGLAPTFETLAPDAFIVFNGYDKLSGYTAPRTLAHMTGWTYRKVEFRADPMYINAGGFLVGPEAVTQQYADHTLTLSVSTHSSLFTAEQEEKSLIEAAKAREAEAAKAREEGSDVQ